MIWIAFSTIVRKEVMRFLRIWVQTLLPPVITSTLYVLIFGQVMGHYVQEMHGLPYMTYIIPGLVMMAVINNAYSNVVSSFFGAKFQRHIEEILVSPTPLWVMMAGYLVGGVLRGLLVGLLVMGVSVLFNPWHMAHPILMLLILCLTALLFSLAGFLNALFSKKFDDISIIPTFVLTPLTYLGGVFYSIQLLSPFWQQVSLFNPLFYMIHAFRYSCLGISDVSIAWSLLIMISCNMCLLGVCCYLLNKGVGMKT